MDLLQATVWLCLLTWVPRLFLTYSDHVLDNSPWLNDYLPMYTWLYIASHVARVTLSQVYQSGEQLPRLVTIRWKDLSSQIASLTSVEIMGKASSAPWCWVFIIGHLESTVPVSPYLCVRKERSRRVGYVQLAIYLYHTHRVYWATDTAKCTVIPERDLILTKLVVIEKAGWVSNWDHDEASSSKLLCWWCVMLRQRLVSEEPKEVKQNLITSGKMSVCPWQG